MDNINNEVIDEVITNDIENISGDDISKLESKAENLKDEKEYIKKELLYIKEERQYITTQRSYLEKVRADIKKKESEIALKEVSIEEEYRENYDKAISTLNLNLNKIKDEIEAKKKELDGVNNKIDSTKRIKLENVENEINKYRENKIKEIEKQYNTRMNDLEVEFNSIKKIQAETLKARELEINSREKELLQKNSDYMNKLNEIQETEKKLNEKFREKEIELKELKLELEDREEDCRFKMKWVNTKKESMEKDISQQVQERSIEIKQSYERKIDDLKEMVSNYEEKIEEYENTQLRAGRKSVEELVKDIQYRDNKISILEEKLSRCPNEEVIIELKEKANGYEILKSTIKQLTLDKSKLENERHTFIMMTGELEKAKEEMELEKRRREAISAQIEKYIEEVERLKTLAERPKERAARIESIETPYLKLTNRVFEDINESEWLDIIHKKCNESGINFNRRLLNAFHTSLKTSDWSPLTILAGVSGTGKSELPRLYSRFGGMYYIPLPVQPDWDSPQSLVGYFNSIDNRFNATPLLRAMVQCQASTGEKEIKDSISDKMLLILLDEMNLAHVELYFSDLLSKLETRRGDSKAVYLEVDLGAGEQKYQVELSKNILWAGTMNEDETTKSLSDKVLDRGSLISFPRPVTFERRKQLMLAEESPMLKREVWDRWLANRIQFDDELNTYKECLEAINSHLEIVGRALGHRVWQAIENYISNHPMVIEAYNEESDMNLDRCIQLAFEEALVYKVMPKLRGIETDGDSKHKCLNEIRKRLLEVLPESLLLEDFDIACQSAYGIFTWKSAKYLDESYGE